MLYRVYDTPLQTCDVLIKTHLLFFSSFFFSCSRLLLDVCIIYPFLNFQRLALLFLEGGGREEEGGRGEEGGGRREGGEEEEGRGRVSTARRLFFPFFPFLSLREMEMEKETRKKQGIETGEAGGAVQKRQRSGNVGLGEGLGQVAESGEERRGGGGKKEEMDDRKTK